MSYTIQLTKKARKFIASQPRSRQEQLLRAIYKLPDAGDIKPIEGTSSLYRLRVGQYRVIYTLQSSILTVTVINIGNRGDIYK